MISPCCPTRSCANPWRWAAPASPAGCFSAEDGRPPSPPFLLAANHLSYVDVFVLASRLPVRFVAKVEVRRWPVLGPISRGFGTIFINRSDRRDIPRVLAEIEQALGRGEGIILFP